MTFEDWYKSVPDNQYVDQKFEDREHAARSAWNAAIASSLDAVDAVLKQNIDENDMHVYIYEDLKKLLTNK